MDTVHPAHRDGVRDGTGDTDVVDTTRYPLHEPGGPAWLTAVADARRALAGTGCAVSSGFVRPAALERVRDECDRIAPDAHYETRTVNVYNTAVDESLPAVHPARFPLERGNAFVARDRIPDELAVHRLYRSPAFRAFLAACTGGGELHELADPLSGLCLNVVTEGREHPWHFDTNEVAISLLTRAPEAGGVFEYCPDIRAAGAENTDAVAAVLAGRADHLVQRLVLRPGDLQIFRGRFSLHRVTPVAGRTPRHTAIFSYSGRPGVVGTEERTRQLFGRVLPDHVRAGSGAVRSDELMD